MQMRWLAAGVAALLITGGGATVAQRVITQKTRGVLPEKDDSAHADSRSSLRPTLAIPGPDPADRPEPIASVAVQPVLIPADRPLATTGETLLLPAEPEPAAPQPATEPDPAPVIATTAVVAEAPVATAPPVSTDAPASPADAAISPANGTRVVPVAADTTPTPTPAPASPGPATAKLDPVDSVETFVERNRKEAAAAIDSLSTEAENLKSRLVRVESALARWQSFSRALNADQPTSQTEVPAAGKPNWKRSESDPTARSTQSLPAGDSPPAAPEPTLEIPRAEVPANPPLPTPADAPEAKPPTTEPTVQPLPDPPTASPAPGK